VKVGIVAWRELGHPGWGGSEVVVDRVAKGFLDRGWTVSLLCAGPIGARPYRVVANGGRFSQYLRAPFAWRRVGHVDVVIDVSNGIPFFAPLWQRRPTVCLVHHVHADQWRDVLPRPLAAIGWFLERRIVPKVYRRFWSVSPSTSAGLRGLGIPADRIREIFNGIDVDSIAGAADHRSVEPLFVVIARLVPHKGVDRVLDAWQAVGPTIGGELVVIGEGPLRSELEARGVPATRFVGHVSDELKLETLRKSWALVHGAHHEGWGIVVMEAAAVGIPTLAFTVPGVRDAVVDGTTGLLADNGAELGEHWLRLAADASLRETLGRNALERARSMSWDAVAELAAEMVEAVASGAW
jgi:glycosyltransferase involved in cell wall biosynthesis